MQTFCTSSRRPETGRSRRRLGAWPSLSCRTRRPRRQPVGWRGSGSGRGDDGVTGGAGLRVFGRGSDRAAWATRPGAAPGRRAGHCRRAPGCGGASVPGRSSKLKGASRRKRRPCGPPLTSEPLRPSGRSSWAGRWPALTGCAPPTPSPTRCRRQRQLRLGAALIGSHIARTRGETIDLYDRDAVKRTRPRYPRHAAEQRRRIALPVVNPWTTPVDDRASVIGGDFERRRVTHAVEDHQVPVGPLRRPVIDRRAGSEAILIAPDKESRRTRPGASRRARVAAGRTSATSARHTP